MNNLANQKDGMHSLVELRRLWFEVAHWDRGNVVYKSRWIGKECKIVSIIVIGIKHKIFKCWLPTAGVLIIILVSLTGCGAWNALSGRQSFSITMVPPMPDYAHASAWLAFPGRNGLERLAPPGFKAVDEASAPADVFFIHPTTYLKNDVMNAPYDIEGELNASVLLGQLSVFNGCCVLYAPQYRQASLRGIPDDRAIGLAYSDALRAFRYYIAHYNHGRPFIIASHSQGTEHAVRLLQEEIVGKPLQDRLIVAYTIGAYTPSTFSTLGLPICSNAQQTGCIVSWNTVQKGRTGASFLVEKVKFWWQGKRIVSSAPAVCVNPLTWNENGNADALANLGTLEFPGRGISNLSTQLTSLLKGLTGARCTNSLLEVNLHPELSFSNWLALLFGSYHLNDYGIFYANLRSNASERVMSWKTFHSNSS
jgi:hypothetical protein